VQEHSLSSGADGEANPVAALPGLVLAPGVVKAVVAFMAAEGPEQVGLQRVGAAAALTSSAGLWLDVLCMRDATPCRTVAAVVLLGLHILLHCRGRYSAQLSECDTLLLLLWCRLLL
jgi:hypothetical protein